MKLRVSPPSLSSYSTHAFMRSGLRVNFHRQLFSECREFVFTCNLTFPEELTFDVFTRLIDVLHPLRLRLISHNSQHDLKKVRIRVLHYGLVTLLLVEEACFWMLWWILSCISVKGWSKIIGLKEENAGVLPQFIFTK